jgi:hypothetical protein
MQCLYCDNEASPGKASCDACFSSASRKVEAQREFYTKPQQRPFAFRDLISPSVIFYGIGALVLLVAILIVKLKPHYVSTTGAISLSGQSDPCSGRDYCLILYSAPWCPACHAAKDFMIASATVVNQSRASGAKIIVGMGRSEEQNISMAKDIGVHTFLDRDGSLARSLGVRGVPHWYVINREGKVLNHDGGLPADGSREAVYSFFQSQLSEEVYQKIFMQAQ